MTKDEALAIWRWMNDVFFDIRAEGPTFRAMIAIMMAVALFFVNVILLFRITDGRDLSGLLIADAAMLAFYPTMAVTYLMLRATNNGILRVRGKRDRRELDRLRKRTAQLERELDL